mmetsp:Transcript_13970/g.23748  ORF Transcript_13970/g.23748 Transcript_13970/m.23748 type:complete len:134 (+) Transcript_13970:99-500(+)
MIINDLISHIKVDLQVLKKQGWISRVIKIVEANVKSNLLFDPATQLAIRNQNIAIFSFSLRILSNLAHSGIWHNQKSQDESMDTVSSIVELLLEEVISTKHVLQLETERAKKIMITQIKESVFLLNNLVLGHN